ncbi:MAG: DUF354 domain-containing protein [Ignavibacteria bacterium]|nr:DUF354 domain-containing protein [Ignavibacteria bacterium]
MIWFDLDNSPHVPLFLPVFTELNKRGISYDVTARDFAQTLDLLKMWDVQHTAIGAHGGKSKIKKIINLFQRKAELSKYIKGKYRNNVKPALAVSHGSRTQLVASRSLGIKTLLMMDYEFTETRIFNRYADVILAPVFIPNERFSSNGIDLKKVIRYNGFKEELYLCSFAALPDFRKSIGVDENEVLAVVRPPGMLGNYHDSRSEELLIHALNHLSSHKNCVVLITSRSQKDRDYINANVSKKNNIRFLEKAVDGLELVSTADIVLSGGGTMNRESALLGTKTFSIFTGKRPYLDEYLAELGRLKFIETKQEIESIAVERITEKVSYEFNKNIVNDVTDIIAETAGMKK